MRARLKDLATVVSGRLRRIGARRLLLAGIAASVLLSALMFDRSWLGRAVERHVAWRSAFWARTLLARGPGLDARIKIFAFDDVTVGWAKALDLALDDWATVIEALDRRRPRAILFDKLFDKPYAPDDMARFVDRLSRLPNRTPVVVAAFPSAQGIPLRVPLPERVYRGYGWSARLPPVAALPVRHATVYGADIGLSNAFAGIGHIHYEGDGYATPIYRLNETDAVPHLTMLVGSPDFEGMTLKLESGGVPIRSDGRLLVNMDDRSVYASRAYGMSALIKRARDGRDVDVVDRGDLVVVLPAMFTGAGDWVETPVGSIEGGYVITAMLHSVVTGAWIREPEMSGLLIVLAVAAGYAAGCQGVAGLFWISLFGGSTAFFVVPLALFVYASVAVSWPLPMVSYTVTALGTFAVRSHYRQLEQVAMAKEMETASLVQSAFIPTSSWREEGLVIESYYEPASVCGGDWWAAHRVSAEKVLVLVGDATGHGVGAALVTAMAHSACASYLRGSPGSSDVSPARLMMHLNDVMREAKGQVATMTLLAVMIDLRSGVMKCANAGHLFPLIIRAGGASRAVTLMQQAGNPLGFGEYAYHETEELLVPGDKLVLYTDGLIENRSRDGETWGKNLARKIAPAVSGNATELRDHIVKSASAHFGSAHRDDDMTVVVVERTPPVTKS